MVTATGMLFLLSLAILSNIWRVWLKISRLRVLFASSLFLFPLTTCWMAVCSLVKIMACIYPKIRIGSHQSGLLGFFRHHRRIIAFPSFFWTLVCRHAQLLPFANTSSTSSSEVWHESITPSRSFSCAAVQGLKKHLTWVLFPFSLIVAIFCQSLSSLSKSAQCTSRLSHLLPLPTRY